MQITKTQSKNEQKIKIDVSQKRHTDGLKVQEYAQHH